MMLGLAQICRLACLVGLIQGTNGDNDESCIEHARTALVGQQVNEPFLIMGIQSCCESSHLCEPGTYEWILLNVSNIFESLTDMTGDSELNEPISGGRNSRIVCQECSPDPDRRR
jgi:hypothetical protein